jgi:hypothetical protein
VFRRLIHLALVVVFALAAVLPATAGDRAEQARGETQTVAVALAPSPHAAPARLKGNDQPWIGGQSLIVTAPADVRLTPSRANAARDHRSSRLDVLRRAPAGCRPPPQR